MILKFKDRNFFILIKKILSIFIAAISLIYFVSLLINNFYLIPEFNLSIISISKIFISLILGIFSLFLLSFVWFFISLGTPYTLNIKNASLIYLISQFGKYFPGNIGHFIWRISMAKKMNVPIKASIYVFFVEAAISIFVSIALVALLVAFYKTDLLLLNTKYNFFIYIAFFFSSSLVLFRHHLLKLLSFFFERKYIFNVESRNLLICFALTVTYFLIYGEILKLLSSLFPLHKQLSTFEFAALYSLTWMLGTIFPGAPAGLGVRDISLVTFLTPIYGPGVALGLSVILRVLSLFVDLISFFVAFLISKLRKSSNI